MSELTIASDILTLDRLAAAAWPAPETKDLGGWQLRFGDGVSRRANSCAPFPPTDDRALDTRIARVEAFYRAHGLPPRFQISPAAEPHGLDSYLADKGYEIEAPVDIMTGDARLLTKAGTSEVALSPNGAPDWWDLYVKGFKRDARKIVAHAAERPIFAHIDNADGTPDTIALGVLGGDWLGIFSMFTKPGVRNRGNATRVIAALSGWAVDHGATGIYLQVECHNHSAIRFYEKLGFHKIYSYHYRTYWG